MKLIERSGADKKAVAFGLSHLLNIVFFSFFSKQLFDNTNEVSRFNSTFR